MMAESDTAPQINVSVEAPKAEQRPDRGPRNGEPRGRGERGGRGERSERGEGRTEARPEGGRGEGRGERRPRQDETARPADEQAARVNAPTAEATAPVIDTAQASGEAMQGTVEQAAQGEGGREKRSRDRYGRDRHERGDRGERSPRGPREEAPAQAEAPGPAFAETAAQRPMETAKAAPVAAAPQAAPAQAAPGTRQLPRIQPFTLSLTELSQVAESSGLQWVNSDAAKIAAVQAAIAAEPKPVHVPRARPAPLVIDEGPLILVETRRDLRNVPQPLEQTGSSQ